MNRVTQEILEMLDLLVNVVHLVRVEKWVLLGHQDKLWSLLLEFLEHRANVVREVLLDETVLRAYQVNQVLQVFLEYGDYLEILEVRVKQEILVGMA